MERMESAVGKSADGKDGISTFVTMLFSRGRSARRLIFRVGGRRGDLFVRVGAAILFASTQPAMIAFIVFSFIGIGMALPYLLLSRFPGWELFRPGTPKPCKETTFSGWERF